MNQLYLNDNLSRFEFYNTDCYENMLDSLVFISFVYVRFCRFVLSVCIDRPTALPVSEFIAKFMRLC